MLGLIAAQFACLSMSIADEGESLFFSSAQFKHMVLAASMAAFQSASPTTLIYIELVPMGVVLSLSEPILKSPIPEYLS